MQVITRNKVVPNLRFSNFDGEWEVKPINDVCKLKAGKFVSASKISKEQESGLFSCYGGNGLRGFTRTYTHEGRYSLIGRQGALCGNVKFVSGKFHATEHAIVVIPTNINNPHWLYYQLDRLNLNRYATGQAQPGLSVNVIEKVKASFPSLSEQKKIASFLSAVDDKLQQLTKKKGLLEDYKKGVMQKIFSQELRFKDDNGISYPDWEEKKLNEVLFEHKLKSTGKEEVYSVSVHKGLINQIKHLGRSFSAKNTDHYSLVKPNDIVYTKSPTGQFPYGIIKQAKISKDVIVSPLYGVFTPESEYLGYMLDIYFESKHNVHNYLHSIIQKGAKNTINITNSTFLSKSFKLPIDFDEQRKIGEFLKSIDSKIELVINQIENTKAFKKGLLQQMFV
jgi:type I restriction enzyme S subunit